MYAAGLSPPPLFTPCSTPPLFSTRDPPRLRPRFPNKHTLPKSSLSSIQLPDPKPMLTHPNHFSFRKTSNVNDRLNYLVSQFKSLPEPIDRVKRLLHYATLLPDFDPSGRIESNRVKGCTVQVWLDARMDSTGAIRFRVDSDSEITKGFCFCLIWLLEGASAGEVLGLNIDDLGEMNVGVMPSRVSSRINTWHNVLIEMKKRTKALILERYSELEPGLRLETFSCLNVGGDQISPRGSYSEVQIKPNKDINAKAEKQMEAMSRDL